MFTKTELEMIRDAVALRILSSTVPTRWVHLHNKIKEIIRQMEAKTNVN